MEQPPPYTRRIRVEMKRNFRQALIFGVLTIIAIILFVFFGFGVLARFAGLLGDLKKGSQPVTSNDNTPPIPPRFEPIPKATNKNDLEVTGSTEPGATVVLSLNGKESEILANNVGEFRYTAHLSGSENIVSAYAEDNVGNKSVQTEVQKVIFDSEPPSLAITRPNDGDSFYGPKDRQLVIEGKTESDSQVSINGRHVVVENTGNFTFLTTLSEGTNTLNIAALDVAGNKTEKTLTVNYSP